MSSGSHELASHDIALLCKTPANSLLPFCNSPCSWSGDRTHKLASANPQAVDEYPRIGFIGRSELDIGTISFYWH
jgi:hypothetical protein